MSKSKEASEAVPNACFDRRSFLKGSAYLPCLAIASSPMELLAATVTGSNSASTKAFKLPAGFGWTPAVNILRTAAGSYSVDKTATSLMPGGVTKTYYVDGAKGNNANPGTLSKPLQSLHVALAKDDSGIDTLDIRVNPPSTRILWGSRGFTPTTTPTKNIIVHATDGGELIFAKTSSSAPPAWKAGTRGCFTTVAGTGANNTSPPTDWHPTQRTKSPDGLGRPFSKAVSAAAVASNPGTYFHDLATGLVTICPFDGRDLSGDGYIIPPCRMGANGAFNIRTKSLMMWLDGCTFVGGSPFYGVNSRSGTRGTLVMNRCNFYASSSAPGTNGIGLVGAYDAYLFDCGEGLSWADAFGFHGNGSGSVNAILIRPSHRQFNGRSGSGSDNVFTTHENGRLVVLDPVATVGSDGRTAGVIGSAWLVIAGGHLPASLLKNNQSSTVHVGGSAKCDLYEVSVENSHGPYTYAADWPSVIYAHGMNVSGQTKTGNLVTVPI